VTDPGSGADLFRRYLGVLGVPAREPSLDALTELIAAHLARVPFENVSKLYHRHDAGRRGLPALTQFLDGIERYHFGGTCYANNFHLHELLTSLGYQVMLCGADMAAPNVHMVNLVTLDRCRYLVDVGYGAPLRMPLPLDVARDQAIEWGAFCYRFRPRDPDGRPRLDMYRDHVLAHGYSVTPTPRRIEDFADVIAESYSERATFMHALLVARYSAERSVMLRNLTLITMEGGAWSVSDLAGLDQVPETIEREFDIPQDIARQALEGVQLTRQA